MLPLIGKNVVVIGGSRGVGRRIVEAAIRNGARVLAVARREVPLRQLAQEVCGTEVLSLDATDEAAPSKVFEVFQPDILVLCGGAFPPASHRISLLQGSAVAASACMHLGDSDLQRRRSGRVAEFGRVCRSQAHADIHCKLQSEGIRSPLSRLAILGTCAAHHA